MLAVGVHHGELQPAWTRGSLGSASIVTSWSVKCTSTLSWIEHCPMVLCGLRFLEIRPAFLTGKP